MEKKQARFVNLESFAFLIYVKYEQLQSLAVCRGRCWNMASSVQLNLDLTERSKTIHSSSPNLNFSEVQLESFLILAH